MRILGDLELLNANLELFLRNSEDFGFLFFCCE